MRSEPAELFAPKSFSILQPTLQVLHRLGTQRVNAHAGIKARVRFLDKTTRTQRTKMAAEGGRTQPQGVCQFTGAAWPLAQQFHDTPAMGIGECCQDAVDFRCCSQTHPSILSPLAFSASSRDT